MASLWKRLKVVVPGFGFGAALSLCFAVPFVTDHGVWSQANPLLPMFGPVAGPFAEPLAMVDYSLSRMCLWGGGLLALMALHPCWPRWETAILSALTIAFWFLLGFSYTYACV